MDDWIVLLVIVGIGCYLFLKRNQISGYIRGLTNRLIEHTRQIRSFLPGNRFEETGCMVYFANDRHGQRDNEYRFNYKKVNGFWRAYILRMPSLRGRDKSGNVTHRLYDNGRHYICWDRSVESLEDMQAISRAWADSIQEYIATGTRF